MPKRKERECVCMTGRSVCDFGRPLSPRLTPCLAPQHHKHAYIYTFIHPTYIHLHIHIHTHPHPHTSTSTHTCTNIYVHALSLSLSLSRNGVSKMSTPHNDLSPSTNHSSGPFALLSRSLSNASSETYRQPVFLFLFFCFLFLRSHVCHLFFFFTDSRLTRAASASL